MSQSEEGQRQKLHKVIETVNRIVSEGEYKKAKWNADLIHSKVLILSLNSFLHVLVGSIVSRYRSRMDLLTRPLKVAQLV